MINYSKFSIDELELIEDDIEEVEQFLCNEKNDISNYQKRKNRQLVKAGFKKRIINILGYDCGLSFDELLYLKRLKDIYKYDDMSENEKKDFEEKIFCESSDIEQVDTVEQCIF